MVKIGGKITSHKSYFVNCGDDTDNPLISKRSTPMNTQCYEAKRPIGLIQIFVLSLFALQAFADVKLPHVFGSAMVLQRNIPIPIWGWADKNEKVTITLNNQIQTTKADASGKWMVKFAPMEAGGPYIMVVKGKKNSITFDDILVGEVWLCSGQSNMEWEVKSSVNAAKEIATANFPQIRHLKVAHTVAATPQDDIPETSWKICNPENVGGFTAVGYFFARELYQNLNVPIGLIHTSWGGTHSETWTSREAMLASDEFRELAQNLNINLDSQSELKAQLTKLMEETQGSADLSKQDVSAWMQANFDDGGWRTMELPSLWESRGLPNLDGVVWFRKEFTLSEEQTKKPLVLELGTIDDNEVTYLNGQKVGETIGYNVVRSYTIAPEMLKVGRNMIAVQVNDTGGGGGINGDINSLKISGDKFMLPLAGAWKYRVQRYSVTSTVGPNAYPTLLFNAMLNPLIPYGIKGAIWYQGESNAGRAYQYRKAFPLMIQDWRTRWGQGDFPFLFVQLANFNAGFGNSEKGSTWAELREAQTMTLSLPNTGMACIIDIGEAKDIHPRNKQDVGKRLAANALKVNYNKEMVYAGPTMISAQKQDHKFVVTYKHMGSGLIAKDKYGYIKGFEIAGADQKFTWAKALIEGDKVVVFSENVPDPQAIRYGWADNPDDVNLYNKEGFPAVPFRSDTWKGITENGKFQIGK